jgi:hypothetical protein
VNQLGLELDPIYGIDHIVIVSVNIVLNVFCSQKIIDGIYTTQRINGEYPLFHDIHFCSPYRFGQGMDLTIGIADGDVIMVNQGDAPYTRPRQGLNHPGTDTAYTDDAKMRLANVGKRLLSIQTTYAGKTGEKFFFARHGALLI